MSGFEEFEKLLPCSCRVQLEREDDAVFVRLSGELDMDCERALDGILEELTKRGGVPRVVVDMRAVTFVDSQGVRILLKHEARARRLGFALLMVPPSGQPLKVLQMTGMEQLVPYSAPADAERAVQAPG